MPTRYYFPESEAAAVSPSISGWDHTNSVRRRLLKGSPDSSTLTTTAYDPDAVNHSGDLNAHHRQYVSDPIGAQTISGTVKAQVQCQEVNDGANLFLTLKLLVVSNDGGTVRGTLLSITRGPTEASSSADANRSVPSTALTSVVAQANDRIVVELGLGGSPSFSKHNGQMRWGGNASSGDLPEDETTTATTYRPWIEFSGAITDPALLLSVSDTLALADALAMKMGKVLTESATLAEAFALKTGKVLSDAASLADAVSTVLVRTVSITEALSIVDALSVKVGKVISETATLTDTAQALLVRLPSIQTHYAPRPLITLTVGAATKRYSTETLVVPAAGQVGVAQVGESQVGG